MFTRRACLGLSLIPVKGRERVSFQSKICELVSGKLSKCSYIHTHLITSSALNVFLRHPNHFVLAGANNRSVIITYRFLAAPVQENRGFFSGILTVYFNCKCFPKYTRRLLECLLGISPSGRNPCVGNYTSAINSRF